ncbi:MAG TPA: haloacid dehalogenase type II [Balneolaceae bacterium]|nr:haloacid dehalogenase type II [Balneolaceae bacterium]
MAPNRPKALIFDLNETLLDLSEVRQSVAGVLQGGDEIVSLWFETMLHYSLVANASDNYRNFSDIGAAALIMLAENRNIDMDMDRARDALAPIRRTPPHPDVPPALEYLNDEGYRLAILTNSPREGMEAQLSNAGIEMHFELHLNVEDIGIYKPNRHVYRWAARQLGVAPGDCLFVAAHGWDVAGAMASEMEAAFLDRPGQNLYPLAANPAYVEPDLEQLASKLESRL